MGEKKFHLRVTLRHPTTKRKIEKETVVDGVSIREAEKRWEQLRDELLAGATADAVMPQKTQCDEKLASYLTRWIEHAVKTNKVRPHVLDRATETLERFVLPFLGDLALSDINPQTLAKWAEKLGGLRTDDGEQYASATLHSAWCSLRAVLNDARMLVGFKVDTQGFEFHTKGKPAKAKDVLTREEVLAVLEGARNENFDVACMVWLGFTTGMRFCELSSIQWEDVDLVAGTARIVRSQVHGTVGPTKTETNRTVTLVPAVLEMLKRLPAWQHARGVVSDIPGLVFPARTGGYRFTAMLVKPLQRCADRAGVNKHITPHTMRRTCNNLVRQAAGDIAARARLVIHRPR